MNQSVSVNRRYVAVCSKSNFNGYYFRSFTLPESDPLDGRCYENTSRQASWYFLNRLDAVACIEGCFAEEDFQTVSEVSWPAFRAN